MGSIFMKIWVGYMVASNKITMHNLEYLFTQICGWTFLRVADPVPV